MRIVVFGIGNVYKENKKYIPEADRIIAYIDNNKTLWGTTIDGSIVFGPEEIGTLEYDKIILMSDAAYSMKKQLLELGCEVDSIIHYKEYVDPIKKEPILFRGNIASNRKRSVLIISTPLGYHGGALVASYLGMALMQRGYSVTIAATDADMLFVDEMLEKGLTFAIGDGILHACGNQTSWVNSFEYIVVNTFPMMCCALELSKYRDVFVWLHEEKSVYKQYYYIVDKMNSSIKDIEKGHLHIYAVSKIAKNNYESQVEYKCEGILEYGIPDERRRYKKQSEKIVFAIVGIYSVTKGQDIFVNAIEQLDSSMSDKCEFWFIGRKTSGSFYENIENRIRHIHNVFMLPEKKRSELMSCFGDVDVLVIASREETMSLVATEAMMCKKVCIISDYTGMASYIEDGNDGLIFKCEDDEDLRKKLEWCIINYAQLYAIGKNARKKYEEKFSIGALAEKTKNLFC